MKKHTLTLHYSVQNGGDGSAYPTFMSSKKLAEYDQANMDEGWGESCTGSITLESDSPIIVKDKIETPESYLISMINNDDSNITDFIAEFFPNGKPEFTVQTRKVPTAKEYLYNDIFVNGEKVGEAFLTVENSGAIFEEILNS